MEMLKNFVSSAFQVQTKVYIYLAIIIASVIGVWFLISTGKSLERAKATAERIEIIQKSNEVTNEIKSLPPAARDKHLDQWVREPKPKPKDGNQGHGK